MSIAGDMVFTTVVCSGIKSIEDTDENQTLSFYSLCGLDFKQGGRSEQNVKNNLEKRSAPMGTVTIGNGSSRKKPLKP